MNCLQCNALLEDHARFCRSCGAPVAINSSKIPSTTNVSPTVPTPMSQPYYAPQEQGPLTLPAAPEWSSASQAGPVTPQSPYAPQGQSMPQTPYAPQEQWMPEAQPYMPSPAIQPGSMQS